MASFDRGLVLFGLAGSQLLAAGRDAGLAVASEVFADRAYDDDGMLVDRSRPGAMVTRPEDVVERAVQMSVAREVRSVGGRVLRVEADTICVHGDTKGAVDLARGIRAGLEQAGVQVRSGLRDQ